MAEQPETDTQPQARRRSRVIRPLAFSAIGLVGLAVLLVIGAFAWVNSQPGRDWLVRFLEDELSTPGEQVIKIGSLDGGLPSLIQLRDVTLADRDGVWLSLSTANLDWRPLDLLDGSLTIRALDITDLEVARLPDSPAEDSEEPEDFSLPELPFNISVEQLEIADIKLGEAVLGTAASFHVTGEAAAATGDSLRSALKITRTDGTAGRVDATAVYWPDDDRLKVDIKLDEPAGGLIARSLELPDLPAVDLALSGEGPVESWQGHLTASLGGLGSMEAELSLARAPELSLQAKGTAQGEALPATFPWPLVKGPVAFELDAAWREERELVLKQLKLDGERLAVEADGTLDSVALTLDAKADVTIKDMAPLNAEFAPLSLQGLRASATAKGALLQPDVTLDLDGSGLDADGLTAEKLQAKVSITPSGPFDDDGTSIAFSGNGSLDGVRVEPEETTAPLVGQRLTWTAAGTIDAAFRAVQLDSLDLTGEAVSVAGSGQVDLSSGAITAKLDSKLDDLAALQAVTGQALQGNATAKVEIDAEDFGASLRATVAGALGAFRSGIALADELVGETPTFGADVALGENGVSVSAAHVEGSGIWLKGDLDFPPDFTSLNGSYSAGLDRLARLSSAVGTPLAGEGSVEGKVSGALSDPQTSGVLDLRDAVVEDIALGQLVLNYQVEDLISAPRGHLAAKVTAPAGSFAGDTDFALQGERLALDKMRVTSEGATVTGNATVPLDGTPVTAEITAEIARLTPWLELVGQEGGGSVELRATLSADGARQAAEAEGRFDNLSYAIDQNETITVKEAAFSVTAGDLADPTNSQITLRASKLAAAGARLSELSLDARGDATGADFTLQTRGELQGELALDAKGRVALEGETTTLSLAALDGTLLGRPLALQQPTSLTVSGADLALSGLRLTFSGGEIDASAKLDDANLSADLRVTGLPLDVAQIVAPDLSVAGTLDGQAKIAGPRSNPTGTAQFTARDMKLNDAPDLPAVETEIDADWRDGRVAVTGSLSGFARESARFTAEGPLQLAPDSLAVVVPQGQPIAAQLDWQGDLNQIWPLVPIDGHRLSGSAKLNFAAAGTLNSPNLSGQFTVSNGLYENLEHGTRLNDLALTFDLDGERATLASLTAHDGDAGRLTAKGSAEIAPERGFPFKINTDFQDFTMLRRDDLLVVKDGKLVLGGTMESVELSGELVSKRIEVNLGRDLPPSVIDLKVVEVNRAAVGLPEQEESDQGGGPIIKLDLTIDLPGRVFVRGLGLDSEWGGDLTVEGTTAQPRIEGELHVVRGQMSFIGRPFQLDRGNITFTGEKEINPILDIAAVSSRGDITVTALITGTANDPKFELTSVPPLPQDEILARALFGKSTSELSAFEAAQLAQAVAELSGRGGGTGGVLDFTRNLLGVDVLRVESDESGGPAVAAGRYLSDDVYVGVKQGTTEGSGSVGVEVELTPNISLKSDVGQSGESDIGVNFKWDY